MPEDWELHEGLEEEGEELELFSIDQESKSPKGWGLHEGQGEEGQELELLWEHQLACRGGVGTVLPVLVQRIDHSLLNETACMCTSPEINMAQCFWYWYNASVTAFWMRLPAGSASQTSTWHEYGAVLLVLIQCIDDSLLNETACRCRNQNGLRWLSYKK